MPVISNISFVDINIPTCVKQNAHELILDFIRSRPPLKPVTFGSLPCLAQTCQCDIKSTSCIDLSVTEAGCRPQSRIRVLLKAPTLAEMEEMNIFETRRKSYSSCAQEEFSHPVDSLALTVDEVINVRRILVKAEMEKYMQNKDLYTNLKKGKMKIPYKKLAHIPVYTVGFHSNVKSHKSDVYKSLHFLCRHSVEEEFPHMYSAGCNLRDVCSDCTKFVADVISSSRRSLDIINNTPKHTKTPDNTSQQHVSNMMNK
ncbi:protein spire-like protein 2 [Triplophysa rosa]|uniref:Protein spire-like protein 2 n=1 Tax=Triplophysa rosa TaxID=992332 RepID=A0A9W7W820_TRIRA|nr:protein spire-like protein 2 [Triplophysa rosa]